MAGLVPGQGIPRVACEDLRAGTTYHTHTYTQLPQPATSTPHASGRTGDGHACSLTHGPCCHFGAEPRAPDSSLVTEYALSMTPSNQTNVTRTTDHPTSYQLPTASPAPGLEWGGQEQEVPLLVMTISVESCGPNSSFHRYFSFKRAALMASLST